ncbi:response regulator transcription factor [Streptomyces bluensis]|uniref:LuxR C-terminal-related transcriptional regulator n=1 Tax=Streptomyces bluensis TaxID=33897 RepID=A0ABW6UDQ0_9ACTN
MSAPIRVLLVDDRAIARTGIRAVLDEDRDIEVVGEAPDLASAVAKARHLQPRLLLAGVLSQAVDPVELVDELHVRCGERVPGVLLMANEADTCVRRAFQAGVQGVVLSRVTPGQLLSAVHVVAAGYRIYFDERVVQARDDDLVPQVTSCHDVSTEDTTGISLLTRREKEVFRLLAQGLSNTEISTELVLSENTVKSHVQRLLEKLNLRNRVHAVIHAYRTGLVTPPCPELGPQQDGDSFPYGSRVGASA